MQERTHQAKMVTVILDPDKNWYLSFATFTFKQNQNTKSDQINHFQCIIYTFKVHFNSMSQIQFILVMVYTNFYAIKWGFRDYLGHIIRSFFPGFIKGFYRASCYSEQANSEDTHRIIGWNQSILFKTYYNIDIELLQISIYSCSPLLNTISGSKRCLAIRRLYIHAHVMSMKAHASVEYLLKMNVLVPKYPCLQYRYITKFVNLVGNQPDNGFYLKQQKDLQINGLLKYMNYRIENEKCISMLSTNDICESSRSRFSILFKALFLQIVKSK